MTDASKIELLLRGVGTRNDYHQEHAFVIETPE